MPINTHTTRWKVKQVIKFMIHQFPINSLHFKFCELLSFLQIYIFCPKEIEMNFKEIQLQEKDDPQSQSQEPDVQNTVQYQQGKHIMHFYFTFKLNNNQQVTCTQTSAIVNFYLNLNCN